VLAVLAAYLKTTGQIGSGIVVSTVMSNIGLEEALNRMALTHASCQVGDRYVMEKMSETGSLLGGEDSGHIILREHHSTGDGLLSGLKLMEAMKQQGKPLSELARVMTVYPQVLLNVTVDAKPAFESMPRLTAAINATEAQLGTSGRVLVRYSGTEPICRVMVEAPTKRQAESLAESIAQAVQEEIG
jgi:phosphoglucosamine mutase